jgi:hypothetical protein
MEKVMTQPHYVTNIDDDGFEPIPCSTLNDAFAVLMGQVGCFYYFERREGVMVLKVEHADDMRIEGLAEGRFRSANPDDRTARAEIVAEAVEHPWAEQFCVCHTDFTIEMPLGAVNEVFDHLGQPLLGLMLCVTEDASAD